MIYMLNALADLILLFSTVWIIVPILMFLMLKYPFEKWGPVFFLVAFALIFNPFLKNLFQIPLFSHLGKSGYAFPSGHMQVSSTFYLAMGAQFYSKRLHAILLVVLTGIGYALVINNFHNWSDVGAGVCFAIITVSFFKYIKNKKIAFSLMSAMGVGMLLNIKHLALHQWMIGAGMGCVLLIPLTGLVLKELKLF